MTNRFTQSDLLEARRVLEIEAQCILSTSKKLDEKFSTAVQLILDSIKDGGKVVVTGVGKSGKIGSKIAGTLSSVGAPSVFLHPTEGAHGDLGLIRNRDVVLAISYSGTAEEILLLLPSMRNLHVKIISIVGNLKSPLAQNSDLVLDGSVEQEACSLNLAPTSSTTVALALGDALAVSISRRLGLKEEEFAVNHPAGVLGRRLTLRVRDLMKQGGELPWVLSTATMDTVVSVATEKKCGAVLVKNTASDSKWVGLITDGDLRRALKHRSRFFDLTAADIMTQDPVSIDADEKAICALSLMENRPSQINVLPVTDETSACVGLVRLHDLIGNL